MAEAPKILFIDAATFMGWAFGPAGHPPESGSRFFAKSEGASQGAIFAGSMRFVAEMIREHGTNIHIFIEEPLPPAYKQDHTNAKTTQVTFGLPACIRGMAYVMGCFNVHYTRVSAIRNHFIGKNPRGETGKELVMTKCLELGWISFGDPGNNHDRTDALAGWSWAEHHLAPDIAIPVRGLFQGRGKKG